VPVIEYKNFTAFDGDSADLQLRFTDGDGDIGVYESDSTKTFWYTYYYQDTVSLNYLVYYRPYYNDTLKVGYVIKSPSNAYKGKSISGEVSVRIQKYRHSKKIKHVKYVFYLLDAAGNKSNIITTPAIAVP
jgi:hypothetical protein